MKYFFIITLIFFIGCNSKKDEKNIQPVKIDKVSKPKKTNIIKINLQNLKLEFKNNKLIYPSKKIYILFSDNSNYSKMEEEALNYLKIKYFKTNNIFLKKYFNIKIYPTIVILDKNKTIKLENYTPIEILKGF